MALRVKRLVVRGAKRHQADPARGYYAVVSKHAADRPEVAAFVDWLKVEAAGR